MLTIAIHSGTNRRGGNTAKVVDHIDAIYRALGQPTQIIDLAALPPEVISSFRYAETPAAFKPFAKAVLECAGLHVVTPEGNGRRSRDSEVLHRNVEISREPRPKARLLHRGLCRGFGAD
jgi:hypothetical protein